MILYHGSNQVITTPDLTHSRRTLDFGPGFYTTTDKAQSEKFARAVVNRAKEGQASVNMYDFDNENAYKQLKIKSFSLADEEWLDFVCYNRRTKNAHHDYDIVYGPVADDQVLPTIVLFESGLYSKKDTIEALKTYKLVDQLTFCSQKALDCLKFLHYYITGVQNA
jgi:hypothetical protein